MGSSRGWHSARELTLRCLWAVAVASLMANVALTWRARKLERELTDPASGTAPVGPVGLIVAPLTGVDGNGTSVTIDQAKSSRPTVLYILAPNCPYCAQNRNNILSLAQSNADTYRFIGVTVSRDGPPELQDQYPFPIIGGVEVEQLARYGFAGTPQTLVIDSAGYIERNWIGAYRGATLREVEDWFGVRLPGIVAEPRVHAQGNSSPVVNETGAIGTAKVVEP